jgi:hypothetical protein
MGSPKGEESINGTDRYRDVPWCQSGSAGRWQTCITACGTDMGSLKIAGDGGCHTIVVRVEIVLDGDDDYVALRGSCRIMPDQNHAFNMHSLYSTVLLLYFDNNIPVFS